MKTIKSVITLFLVLALSFQLQAQWVGKKEVKVKRNASNTQQVQIGSWQDSQDKSFEWRGPHIVGDNKYSPVITVNPQDEREEYFVRRVSKCGVEEDKVVVIVTDEVTIVSVTPKVECYALGDTILKDDFDIVTDPPGEDDKVVMLADKAMVNPQQVPFYISNDGHESSKSALVDVYPIDTDMPTDGISVDFVDIKNKIEKAKTLVENAAKITDVVAEYAPAGCVPSVDLSKFKISSPGVFNTCCNGNEKIGFKLKDWELGVALNYDCTFPIPLISYPPIAEVSVIFGFQAGVDVGPATVIFRGWNCISGHVPIELFASAYGGVEVSVANPGFLSASLKLEAGARTRIIWEIGDDIHWESTTLYMKIVGEMKVFGVTDITPVEWELGKITLFND